MSDTFQVIDGRIVRWDGIKSGGHCISKEELIESFGQRAFEQIERFGFYVIQK